MTTTKRADSVKVGDQVVERDGAMLEVVGVEVALKSVYIVCRSMMGTATVSLNRSRRVTVSEAV